MERIFLRKIYFPVLPIKIKFDKGFMLIFLGGSFSDKSFQLGLVNNGLTCYLNSLMCMLHRVDFSRKLIDSEFGGDRVLSLLRFVLIC